MHRPPTKRIEAPTSGGRRSICDSLSRRRRPDMRENSGQGDGTNNNRNPTLRDHERAAGRSGEAIHGDRKKSSAADRTSPRKRGADAS
jgi:hypothetical protein